MSTATPVPEPYRAKIWKNQKGELFFTVATCPRCEMDFRLLWPCGVLAYPEKATLHLECPGCKHAFTSKDLKVGKLCQVGVGCEYYPAAPVLRIEL